MSITEGANLSRPATARRPTSWSLLVAGSALLLGLIAVAGAIWWAASSESRVTSYRVLGDLAGVELDLGAASAELTGGGGGTAEVRRTDTFAFGQPAAERRRVEDSVLKIRSRCPDTVLGTCRASYRIAVPDNVPVTVKTDSGRVRLTAFRGSANVTTASGPVTVTGFCGYLLRVSTGSGSVTTSMACSPDLLQLRSSTGDVRAIVPPGRYQVDAATDGGSERIRGVEVADDAPFRIQALSGTGDVTVEAGGT